MRWLGWGSGDVFATAVIMYYNWGTRGLTNIYKLQFLHVHFFTWEYRKLSLSLSSLSLSSARWHAHILYVGFRLSAQDQSGKEQIADCPWLQERTPGPHLTPVWLISTNLWRIVCQRPLLVYCIITELNCDSMWLVYVGAQRTEPPRCSPCEELIGESGGQPHSREEICLSQEERLSLGQDSLLLLAQAHALTHINKCTFCIGLTALPSLLLLFWRAE